MFTFVINLHTDFQAEIDWKFVKLYLSIIKIISIDLEMCTRTTSVTDNARGVNQTPQNILWLKIALPLFITPVSVLPFLVAPAAEQSDLSSHYGVCLFGCLFVCL